MTKKKRKRTNVPAAAVAVTGLTLQRHTLLQIKDVDPDGDDHLEIVLGSDDVRVAMYCYINDGGGRLLSLRVSPADFAIFVEQGRAHSFAVVPPEGAKPQDWTFREDPILRIWDMDKRGFLEIVLRSDGVSFVASASDPTGIWYEHFVRITPASFQALVARGQTHQFEVAV